MPAAIVGLFDDGLHRVVGLPLDRLRGAPTLEAQVLLGRDLHHFVVEQFHRVAAQFV